MGLINQQLNGEQCGRKISLMLGGGQGRLVNYRLLEIRDESL